MTKTTAGSGNHRKTLKMATGRNPDLARAKTATGKTRTAGKRETSIGRSRVPSPTAPSRRNPVSSFRLFPQTMGMVRLDSYDLKWLAVFGTTDY